MRIEDVEEASRVLQEIMVDCWERFEKGYYPRQALEFDIKHNSPEMLKQRFEDVQNFSFVAEENNAIVAAALGKIIGESGLASLGWIGVQPRYQRRGIGKALLLNIARERGVTKLF